MAAGYSGTSADEFIAILRHLAEAVSREAADRNGHRKQHVQGVAPSPLFVPGRFQLLQAKLESVLQDTQEFVSSVSVLLCVGFLTLARKLNYVWLGFGNGRADGLGKSTSVHWSLTNLLVQLQALRQEKRTRQDAVYDFLRTHRISAPLSNKVKRYVKRSHVARARELEAEALRKLSAELLLDLHDELRAPALSTHPFFCLLRARHPHLIRELCREALQPLLRAPEEVVFLAGEQCCRMYFVVSGQLQYTSYERPGLQRRSPDEAQSQRMLCSGDWLSEAALWTSWVHRGDLRVVSSHLVSDCLLFALDASGFARVVSGHKAAHVSAAAYARRFVEGLNAGPYNDLSDPAPVD